MIFDWQKIMKLILFFLYIKKEFNAAFGCFALMPFYDIVSFTAATTITGIPASLSATLHPF